MVPRDDGERERPNWRDIDRRKDKSFHTRERKPVSTKKQFSSKSYKAALDQFFDSGKIGKAAGWESSESGKSSRLKLIRKVKESDGIIDISEAVDELLKDYPMPDDDFDFLVKVLDHQKLDIVQQALEKLLALLEVKVIKRKGVLLMKLEFLKENASKREVRVLAGKVHEKVF